MVLISPDDLQTSIYIVRIWKMEQNLLALEALEYMELHFSVPCSLKKN